MHEELPGEMDMKARMVVDPFLCFILVGAVLLAPSGRASSLAVSVTQPSNSHQVVPVVVELFTAEGCSDCPPADDLLSSLAQGPPSEDVAGVAIIPLEFHVDYWDQLGWRDRFDDARFTARQRDYQAQLHIESTYTPQSVIDGHYETVGNDRQKVVELIRRAAKEPKPVTIQLTRTGDAIAISAHASDAKLSSRVLLVITEDGLSTDVKAGENNRKTLHHDSVVRSMESVGKIQSGSFNRSISLKLRNAWRREKLHVVVLAQEGNGHIVGAAMTSLL